MTNTTDTEFPAPTAEQVADASTEPPAELVAMLPAIGSKVVADDGKTYRVVWAQVAGKNTRRAAPSVAGDLGLVLDSKRAKTCYLSVLRTDGSVEKGISVGPWTE